MTKTEQEIREELNRLSTYRVPNSTTDLVPLKAVERVLNLVFRGNRDKDPQYESCTKTGRWIEHFDNSGNLHHLECSNCHNWHRDYIKDNFCPNCGCRMESEVKT